MKIIQEWKKRRRAKRVIGKRDHQEDFLPCLKGNPITLLDREDAFLMDRERRIAQMVSKDGEKISLIAWSYSMGPETRSK